MSNESFLNYSVDSDVINHYLRLLADKNIKERNGNIALAKKLRLSEDALAALQQEFVILQQQLALIESNQLPCHKKNAADKEIKQDEYGDYYDWVVLGVTQRFRWIQPGEFLMGSPNSEEGRKDDEIQHPVTLTKGFWMADTACTQALWLAVMGNNPANFSNDLECPVEQVSWDDIQLFLQRANDLVPDKVLRLPTEAEWEYACRAGITAPFAFGTNITPQQVNYNGNEGKTVPVKSLPANAWGLYEMHGNVCEWCQDLYGDYSMGVKIDPKGVSAGTYRVLRGGAWINYAQHVRSANRNSYTPDFRNSTYGFRLVLPVTVHGLATARV